MRACNNNNMRNPIIGPCFTVFWLYRNSCMPYYVSIKPYNSTVQEFCAVQGFMGLSAPATSIASTSDGESKKTQQIMGTESINTCNANGSYTNPFAAHLCWSLVALPFFETLCTTGYAASSNTCTKLKMAYNREEVCGRGS